jgi:hypothetical protein
MGLGSPRNGVFFPPCGDRDCPSRMYCGVGMCCPGYPSPSKAQATCWLLQHERIGAALQQVARRDSGSRTSMPRPAGGRSVHVPRATAADSPVRAVRARRTIGRVALALHCARTYVRTWIGAAPSTSSRLAAPFPVRWRVVTSGSLCEGWP